MNRLTKDTILLGCGFLLLPVLAIGCTKSQRSKPDEAATTRDANSQGLATRQAVAEPSVPVDDVDLNLTLDFGTLRNLLHDKGRSDRASGEIPLYENAVRIEWRNGVSAMFASMNEYPDDSQTPYSLDISDQFPGSACGVHIGDSVAKAKLGMQVCGCRITRNAKQGAGFAQIAADCRSPQQLLINLSGETISLVEINDKNHVTLRSAR